MEEAEVERVCQMSKGKYRAKDQQEPEPMQACLIPDVPEADDVVFQMPPLRQVFCIDCAHHRTIPPMHYCKASPPNLVTGDSQEWECGVMRAWGRECGPEGRLFEPAGTPIPVLKYEG